MRKVVLCLFILIIVISSGCNTAGNSSVKSPNITNIPGLSEKPYNGREVLVYIPTIKPGVDYEAVETYLVENYGLNISIEAESPQKDGLDSVENIIYGPRQISFMNKINNPNYTSDGIYLFTQWQFRMGYTSTVKEYDYKKANGEDLDSITIEFPMLGYPLNGLEIIDRIDKLYLEPYTDSHGNIWGIPYEYVYPEVKIRKYNKDIMDKLKLETPTDVNELFDVLMSVKNSNDNINIFPQMMIESVFTGYEDIVRAFGIKAPNEFGAFFSIQYDEEDGVYKDIAFDEGMYECINYFTALIDEGIIKLGGSGNPSNNMFRDGSLFSVYEAIDTSEDLIVPYSPLLTCEGYEAHQYFIPSRYVYVLGRDIEIDSEINKFFNALYVDKDAAVVARYGTEDNYNIVDNNIYITDGNLSYAPKLIGEFPNELINLTTNEDIESLSNKILRENIGKDYYRALTPVSNYMELSFNEIFYAYDEAKYNNVLARFVRLFYTKLGEHFFNPDRPTTEDFIEDYRAEAKKLMDNDLMQRYFDYAVPCDTVY